MIIALPAVFLKEESTWDGFEWIPIRKIHFQVVNTQRPLVFFAGTVPNEDTGLQTP